MNSEYESADAGILDSNLGRGYDPRLDMGVFASCLESCGHLAGTRAGEGDEYLEVVDSSRALLDCLKELLLPPGSPPKP